MTLVSFLRRLGLLATIAVLLALPASASALQFHVVNESGRPESEVFVDIAGGNFNVPGFTDDQPKALSEIPGGEVTINSLDSGRIYISYGAAVQEGVPFDSPTRFDWAELTVTPSSTDVANLTAVDQFAIGMRLTTLGAAGEELESVGSTYANTIFSALQGIPGGPESTVRGANGEIIRILSPNKSSAYPLLTEYVHSMAGQTITLHTAYFVSPFTTSVYTGTFQADGSISLTGTMKEEGVEKPAPPINLEGQKLIGEIYNGGETPNDLQGTVRRDLLAAFSIGLWGGKYGNDALSFCTNPNTTSQGTWCPTGFNVPAFAEARTVPAPYTTYEQYASVINQYSDIYGAPYSDASKKVTVGLNQAQVKTLQLTILPDSPPASGGGSTSSGSAPASPAPSKSMPKPSQSPSQVTFKLAKTTKLNHDKLAVGNLTCKGACGKVVALLRPKRGKAVIAREAVTVRKTAGILVLKPTTAGKPLLKGKGPLATKLTVIVTQPGQRPAQKQVPLKLLR
jgi:Beta-1,3-glucanase